MSTPEVMTGRELGERPARKMPTLRPGVFFCPLREAGNRGSEYLVEAGAAAFAVSETVYDVLRVLEQRPASIEELERQLAHRTGRSVPRADLVRLLFEQLPPALLEDSPEPAVRTPFLFRTTLVRERWLEPLTARLTWMFNAPTVLVVSLAAAVGCALTLAHASVLIRVAPVWQQAIVIYLALAISGLVHELGHASACRRYGSPHGSIGFGLYLIYPAFYADVSKAWRLPQMARAVVDLAGMYFQCVLLSGFAGYALLTGNVIAYRLVWITIFSMACNLNPIFKMDGYWLLSDLGGARNLHKQMSSTFRAATRRVMALALGRPHPKAAGGQKWLLGTYCALAATYWGFVGNFLVGAARDVVHEYPRRASRLVEVIRTGTAKPWIGIGRLLGSSVWPLLLGVIAIWAAFRAFRAVKLLWREVSAGLIAKRAEGRETLERSYRAAEGGERSLIGEPHPSWNRR